MRRLKQALRVGSTTWKTAIGTAVMLTTEQAFAQQGGPDPEALGGLFGSVMGTSIVFALGAVAVAAVAVLIVAIPWLMQGGRNVWDQRKGRRDVTEGAWSVERRAQYIRSRGQHA